MKIHEIDQSISQMEPNVRTDSTHKVIICIHDNSGIHLTQASDPLVPRWHGEFQFWPVGLERGPSWEAFPCLKYSIASLA